MPLPKMRPPRLWASKTVPTPKTIIATPKRAAIGAHHAWITAGRSGARSPNGAAITVRFRPTMRTTAMITRRGTAPPPRPIDAATAPTTRATSTPTRAPGLRLAMTASIRWCEQCVRDRGPPPAMLGPPSLRSRIPE